MSKVTIAVVGGCAVIWGLLTISSTASADPSIARAAAAADARISAGPEADDLGSGTKANESRRWELFDVAARSDVARATRRNERNPSVLPVVEHVVYISLDGFNPQAITTLGPARAPAFHSGPLPASLLRAGGPDMPRPPGGGAALVLGPTRNG